MLFHIKVTFACAAFMAATTHIFMLAFFCCNHFAVTRRVRTVHITLARFASEEIFSYYDVLCLIDRNR